MASTIGYGLVPYVLLLLAVIFFVHDSILVEGKNIDAVKTFETEHGDIYDCVDFYKQPAFDHPALKNHKTQMEPTSYLEGMKRENSSSTEVLNIGLPDGGCPKGKVPIRRIQKAEVVRKKPFNTHVKYATLKEDEYNPVRDGHSYAVARTPLGEYYGTEVYMNIWNPQVEKGFRMFSLAQTWVVAGSGLEINSVEAGWQVSFSMYNDNNPRVFVSWTTDGYSSSGCYNTACPGFVQLNEMIPVDYHLDQYISTYNGKQYDMRINIFKDPGSGNWYLYRDDLAIGYWPSAIFNKLNKNAEIVEWGGEVYHDIDLCQSYKPRGNCPYPQMGSGRYPTEGYGGAAYMKDLLVIDNPNMIYNPPKNGTFYNDKPDKFKITQNQKGIQGLPDNNILFGGPGDYSSSQKGIQACKIANFVWPLLGYCVWQVISSM